MIEQDARDVGGAVVAVGVSATKLLEPSGSSSGMRSTGSKTRSETRPFSSNSAWARKEKEPIKYTLTVSSQRGTGGTNEGPHV